MVDDIHDLPMNHIYDVRIVSEASDVPWTVRANRNLVMRAIMEILVMKEKNPSAWEGEIVIQESASYRDDVERETRYSDDRPTVLRSVPAFGRALPLEPVHSCGHLQSIHTIGPKKICALSKANPSTVGFGDHNCECEGLEP